MSKQYTKRHATKGGNFTILENGSLRITRVWGKKAEMREFLKENGNDEAFLSEFYETELCNGFTTVSPADIGALTDGLLIADGHHDPLSAPQELELISTWWHADYMVQPFGETILKQGYIDLPRAR
jgi:hypothetical protein